MKKAEQLLQTSASPVQSLFTIFPFIYGNYYVYLKLKIDLLICLHFFFSLQVSTFPKAKDNEKQNIIIEASKCMKVHVLKYYQVFSGGARVDWDDMDMNGIFIEIIPSTFIMPYPLNHLGEFEKDKCTMQSFDMTSLLSTQRSKLWRKKNCRTQKRINIPRRPFMNHSKWLHAFVMITRMCTYLKL